MNESLTTVNNAEPPQIVPTLINSLVTTVLRSPWHGESSTFASHVYRT